MRNIVAIICIVYGGLGINQLLYMYFPYSFSGALTPDQALCLFGLLLWFMPEKNEI